MVPAARPATASGTRLPSPPLMRGIDSERVSAWLSEHVDGATRAVRVRADRRRPLEPHVQGHRRRRAQRSSCAGRRSGHVLATAHDMAPRAPGRHRASARRPCRWRRRSASARTTSVNGAPFYVMDFVDGVVLDRPDKAERHGADARRARRRAPHRRARRPPRRRRRRGRPGRPRPPRRLHRAPAAAVVEAVGGVQDPRAARHRGGRAPARAPACPPQHGTAIVHGDYRLGNCLVDPEVGRINAVLDWELCTLGDPLADVGYLCIYWTDPGEPAAPLERPDARPAASRPGRELLDRYAATHGPRPVAASTTTSPSRRGGWPSSARACTPATSTA